MSKEITIIVPIKAKEQFRSEVRKKLIELTALTNQEDGNICYCLNQVDSDSNEFIIYEKWKNQDALDFHMNQDYLKNFISESATLLEEDIKGKICSQIA